MRELVAILWLHALDSCWWRVGPIGRSGSIPKALRINGVAKLGRLSERVTTQLAGFVDRQCDTNSKREVGADCRIWRDPEDPNLREWLDENFHELALRPFEPRWRLVTTMGNRVPSEDVSLGSGNGWHRDSNSPQYK